MAEPEIPLFETAGKNGMGGLLDFFPHRSVGGVAYAGAYRACTTPGRVVHRSESVFTGLSYTNALGRYGYAGVGSCPTVDPPRLPNPPPLRDHARGQLYRRSSSRSSSSNPPSCGPVSRLRGGCR